MALSLPGAWKEGCSLMSVHVVNAGDPTVKKQRLNVKPWASVKDVKDQLQTINNTPTSRQRLFFRGKELKNTRTLQECGIYKDGFTILFKVEPIHNGIEPRIQPFGASCFPRDLVKVLHKAQQGLSLGFAPVLAMEGTGGTYFLRGPSQRYVACFKPQDEEPFAISNPRGFVGSLEMGQSGLRKGILAGEACEREVAAYLLDKNHFSGVPATALAECCHPVFNYTTVDKFPKLGSVQEFVQHDDVVGDLSPTMFSSRQVHKIVILDIRLVNSDRNDANILVRKKRSRTEGIAKIEYELIPIDHGYCLSDTIEIAWCDWCWFDWPQLKDPIDNETRDYLLALDPEQDARELKSKLSLRNPCLYNMRIAGTLLKKGVLAGLSLYDVACIMCRQDLDSPSPLEMIIAKAAKLSRSHVDYPVKPVLYEHDDDDDKKLRVSSSTKFSVPSFFGSPHHSPQNSRSGISPFPVSPVLLDCGSTHIFEEPATSFIIKEYQPPSGGSSRPGRPHPIDVNAPPSSQAIASPPGFWASHPPYRGDWDKLATDALNDAAKEFEEDICSPPSERRFHDDLMKPPIESACSIPPPQHTLVANFSESASADNRSQRGRWTHLIDLAGIDGEGLKQLFYVIEKLIDKEVAKRIALLQNP